MIRCSAQCATEGRAVTSIGTARLAGTAAWRITRFSYSKTTTRFPEESKVHWMERLKEPLRCGWPGVVANVPRDRPCRYRHLHYAGKQPAAAEFAETFLHFIL